MEINDTFIAMMFEKICTIEALLKHEVVADDDDLLDITAVARELNVTPGYLRTPQGQRLLPNFGKSEFSAKKKMWTRKTWNQWKVSQGIMPVARKGAQG